MKDKLKRVKQKIVGFHRDKQGHWVADLACGHTRHVRHDPPWQNRRWVLTESGRNQRLGLKLACQKCEDKNSSGGQRMAEKEITETQLQVAEAIKAMCLKAAVEAYEHGKMSGMCREGAWDLALDAIRSLDVHAVLGELP